MGSTSVKYVLMIDIIAWELAGLLMRYYSESTSGISSIIL